MSGSTRLSSSPASLPVDTYWVSKKPDISTMGLRSALIVTLDPKATCELQGAAELVVVGELEVHKEMVQPVSRAKRKLPRPPTAYPIWRVALPLGEGCQWLGITEQWDVGLMDSLPFYRKQVGR
ncbi:hypothetical protein EON64_08670 [archaeon]|nr:MAG: hypothetical protein EON64_08670 [archaeon]